jgi:hypothetical protein
VMIQVILHLFGMGGCRQGKRCRRRVTLFHHGQSY